MASSSSSSSSLPSSVPYFVLTSDKDGRGNSNRAKAVFTVPQAMAESLIAHPILCRGSSFELVKDAASHDLLLHTAQQASPSPSSSASFFTASAAPPARNGGASSSSYNDDETSFLSTEYYSPEPEETARAISIRLAARVNEGSSSHHQHQHVAASFLGV